MRHIKGPDFPTAGTILGREGIRDAYATGRGRVRVQAKAHIEPIGQGKEAIIVTELPFQVRKGGEGGLILKIRDLVLDKKLSEITDLRDESDRHGMRIVIELKRDAIPKVVLNKLYKHTPMQTTFGVNMVALVDNVPRTLSLREAIGHYVDHQREIIVRRTKYELRRAEERAHVLEGLLIALDNLDEVIALIRGSRDSEEARTGLVERFGLTVVQAQAVLQLTLSPPDRARGRQDQAGARRPDRADQGAARDPRRRGQGLRADQGGAAGDRRHLRRRAAHRDHARRGRDRHRGPDRRPADGDLDHPLRLHQVTAAVDLPPAAPRRHRRHRHGHEGRRLHRAPVRLLDPRLPPVLHQPREGLPAQGLRAARGVAHRARAARWSTCCRCARASGSSRCCRRATSARASTSCSPRATGSIKKTEFARLQHADQGRRDHRDQHPRRRRADRRAPHRAATTTSSWSRARARRRASPRAQVRADGPRHQRRARHERLAEGQRGARDGRRARRPGAARRHRERLRQAHRRSPSTRSRAAARWASRRSR